MLILLFVKLNQLPLIPLRFSSFSALSVRKRTTSLPANRVRFEHPTLSSLLRFFSLPKSLRLLAHLVGLFFSSSVFFLRPSDNNLTSSNRGILSSSAKSVSLCCLFPLAVLFFLFSHRHPPKEHIDCGYFFLFTRKYKLVEAFKGSLIIFQFYPGPHYRAFHSMAST